MREIVTSSDKTPQISFQLFCLLVGMLTWAMLCHQNMDKLLHRELCLLSDSSESKITGTVTCVEYCHNQISSLFLFHFLRDAFISKVAHHLCFVFCFHISSACKSSFLAVVLCKIRGSFKARLVSMVAL